MTDSRVYVLGAGCSYDAKQGYPLANGFCRALSAFTSKISTDPQKQRILRAVQDTIDLLARCQSSTVHAATTDQMVNLILMHRCDSDLALMGKMNNPSRIQTDHLRMEAVRKAKLATAACFLDMEHAARNALIGRYRNFIEHKILHDSGPSSPTLTRLRKSRARVLSFNYDRMFELAFFGTSSDSYLQNYYSYGPEVLNSGLEVGGKVGVIAEDRFCFVKLHGSIGLMCGEDHFGQQAYQINDVANWSPVAISDSHFFSDGPVRQASPEPLIVFPYEKDFVITHPANRFEFRDYINNAWNHASKVVQEASEIWVIGYSFDPTDCKYLMDLLKKARKCSSLVIQNLPRECDRIEQLLTDYGVRIPLRKNSSMF
jgi:hypothetical protein